ncbi:hypothetical protein DFH09DRAFT_1145130 [Mycena vulgaris]|nr:hypothetical protein DFH09DRAFT_1145130 [Mycena vulgaris]
MPAMSGDSSFDAPESVRKAARERTAELDMQISTLQQSLQLEALLDERRSCEALLDAYKYPILTLPNEITSEIFLSFLPPRPLPVGPLSPVFLCQICREWCALALSTPTLWSAIHIDFEFANRLPQQLRVLESWLDRSKSCPLSVALRGRTMYRMAIFVEALLPHAARWADMQFILPLKDLRLIRGPMPRLRKALIGPHTRLPPGAAPFLPFDQAPNLTNVVIPYLLDPSVIVLPWAQLTTLAGYLHLAVAAEILRQTPRLERATLTFMGSPRPMEPLAIPPMLHLSSLRLRSHGEPFGNIVRLFDALMLPALTFLQLDEHVIDAPGDQGSFIALVARTPRLEKLCVTRSYMPQGFYHDIFPNSSFEIDVEYGDADG